MNYVADKACLADLSIRKSLLTCYFRTLYANLMLNSATEHTAQLNSEQYLPQTFTWIFRSTEHQSTKSRID